MSFPEQFGRRCALRGYNAWSCDLLPAEDGSNYHLQCDARETLDKGWDMMIAFPPCTHLSGSGARWMTDHWVKSKKHPDGRYWHDGTAKRKAQKEALAFVLELWNAPIPKIALENPVGMLSRLWRKPDQYIQPWQFGHGEQKRTGLWLKELPKLIPTHIVSGREQRVWKTAPSDMRWKERSRTFPGIAEAMADQWGK